jgi:serine/threonine-protein phosphatase PP1-1
MASIPKPGPANLRPGAGLDEWLEEAKQCHYLPEPVMKQLCEIVKEVLMEGKRNKALLTPVEGCWFCS